MIEMYTDGATSKNGYEDAVGGCAYIILEGEKILHKDAWALRPATNNQCEMLAIIEGCQYIEENYPLITSVNIYSDSAYCINCYQQKWYKKWIQNGWVNSKKQSVKNRELWELLVPFFEDNRFNFIKVKGHVGDKYNEMADEMAVKARLSLKI